MAYEFGPLTCVAEVAVAFIVRVASRALAGAWRFLPSLMPIAAIGALIALLAGSPQTAEAACTSAPASNATDDCDGANTSGVIAAASTNVTLNLLTGGSITPAAGPSISLGADADIRLQGGTTTGNAAIANNYAILMGDSSIVTLDGRSRAKAPSPDRLGCRFDRFLQCTHHDQQRRPDHHQRQHQ